MSDKTTAQYGTWTSPITVETLTAESSDIVEVVTTADGKIYTVEAPPSVEGRCTIFEYHQGSRREVLPAAYSARTAVHGYGGSALATSTTGAVIFADWKTKGVFSLDPATKDVTPVVDADPQVFFADFAAHPLDSQWILALREDHHVQPEEKNTLVAVNASDRSIHVLASGADFYTSARFSPAGDRICWIQWDHPDMPWTGTRLFVGSWAGDGKITDVKEIDGEARNVSVNQAKWGPDGTLFYTSDRSGYWQLQALRQGSEEPQPIRLSGLEDGEFSSPEWVLGSSTFVLLTNDTVIATWIKDSRETLLSIDLSTLQHSVISEHLTGVSRKALQKLSDKEIVVIATSPTKPKALYRVELGESDSKIDTLQSSLALDIPEAFYSQAEHISFPRTRGAKPGTVANAFFLPPKNANYSGEPGTLPPLIIEMHGGPTTNVSPGLSLQWQYYTSRGYAMALPNYAGSSGYGREYRDLLDGSWGALDPADAASCVDYLVKTGRVDGSRVGIVGGSSGGHAALEAIWMFPSVWSAAVSRYGISDLERLVVDTHKFEKHYAFRLLFGKTVPDDEDQRRLVYRERSPRFHSDQIKAPVLLLQGSEDKVVPPSQTEMMVQSIKDNGGIAKMVLFEGEGHGFRGLENQRRALVEQDLWWQKYLVRNNEQV